MTTNAIAQNTNTHHGRNIKRLREILGIKQEALAIELGSDWSQKKISMLEAKEEIDAPLMEQVARALNVPVRAIEEFDEEATVYNYPEQL
ncbi:helix-turn-helix transcriptional regulator [Chitinophagaceae bacterium MMS25-I14]